ncbi:hypothetical protein [Aquabacterium sp.]|uniref:hypothetical protein n=1 Tax=Aquabacterium sp. TaxID=1872578 RepID=UPI0025C56FD6|nr:hypothetical protein [Aquabacterium sp.]
MRPTTDQERHAIGGADLRAQADAQGVSIAQLLRSRNPALLSKWEKTWQGLDERVKLALVSLAVPEVEAVPLRFEAFTWEQKCRVGAMFVLFGRECAGWDAGMLP